MAELDQLTVEARSMFADFLPGKGVEPRTLRYKSARRPVLGFWPSEKIRGIYTLVSRQSVSLLQVVMEDLRKPRLIQTIFGFLLVTL